MNNFLHYVWYDEPTATSKKSQYTVCGKFVRPIEVVLQMHQVTCPECMEALKIYMQDECPF